MDALEFIAALVNALAWPLTVLAIALLFRRQLRGLFPALRHIRYRDLEMEFNQQAQALAREAQQVLPDVQPDSPAATFMARMERLAIQSPRAVVLEGWLILEQAAQQALRSRPSPPPSAVLKSPLELGQALEDAGLLKGEQAGIYHKLRNLRNAAVHASDFAFSPEAALDYARTAMQLQGVFQQPAGQAPAQASVL